MIPRVYAAPHGVKTPTSLALSPMGLGSDRGARGESLSSAEPPVPPYPKMIGPHTRIGIPLYLYNSDHPGTTHIIPGFETAPHCEETPAPPADC